MSTETSVYRNLGLKIDWLSAVLVALTVLIQVSAIQIARLARSAPTYEPAQATSMTLAPGIVVVLIVESLFLVGCWRLYKRLPERFREHLKTAIAVSIWGLVLYLYGMHGYFFELLAAVAVGAAYYALAYLDLDWIPFNGMAVVLGIAVTAMAGNALAPIVVLPLLVLVLVWDYVAVDLSDIMGDLVEASSSIGLPNYVIIPNQLRVDKSRLTEALQNHAQSSEETDEESEGVEFEKPDDVAYVIGLGDFALPGLLTVSAALAIEASWLPMPALGALLGTCVAVLVLRHASTQRDGGLPALPWLNTGAIAGYGIGILVSGVPLATALGGI